MSTNTTFDMPDKPVEPRRVAGRELSAWPITISDAPIRCGRCDEIIIGSGTGAVGVLTKAVANHGRTCSQRWRRG